MSIVRRIAKNTIVLLIAQGISYLLAFFYTIYAARYLGPADYGIISLAIAFTAVFAIFMDFGINQLMIRDVSRDRQIATNYIFNAGLIKVVLVCLTYGLMALVAYFMGYEGGTVAVIYLMGLSVVVATFYLMLFSLFQAFECMEYQAIGQILSAVVLTAGILIVINNKLDIFSFAVVYIISSLIVLIYSIITFIFVILRNHAVSTLAQYKVDLKTCKNILKQCWPIGVMSLMVAVHYKIDTILLALWSGDASVGWYNAAYKFIDISMVVPAIFVSALFPTMAYAYKFSLTRYNDIYNKAFKYLLFIALPMAFYVTLFGRQLINMTFGPEYVNSVAALGILIWVGALMYLNVLVGNMYITAGKQNIIMVLALIAFIVNLGLNMILIPAMSYIGAAISAIVTEVLGLVANVVILTKLKHGLSISSIIKAPLLGITAIGLIALIAHTWNVNIYLMAVISAIIYCVIVYKYGINEDDISLVRQLLKKEGNMKED